MSLLAPQTIEEWIIFYLQAGQKSTEELIAEIRNRKGNITKQGFYAALRKLKKEETVVVYKKTVALNTSWVWDMQNMFAGISREYGDAVDVLSLGDRESVSYSFQNTRHLDIFWGNLQNTLIRNLPTSHAVYAYDPHYWFYIARKETELKLLKQITETGRQFLITVGGNTWLDQETRKEFRSEMLQYHIRPLFKQNTYYVVVIGDYVTEVFLDESVAKKVEEIYSSTTKISPETMAELHRLLSVRSRSRLRISRNSRKAHEIRAKLGKSFFTKAEKNARN